jgi:glycosyltransferase involved in cell wall biosynthesis
MSNRDTKRLATAQRTTHVLFLIDQLCEAGGAERAILQTIRLLPRSRFRSSLITFRIDERVQLFRKLPCPHFTFPLRCTYDWNAFLIARKIRRFIREERVDIIHTFHETADLWGGLVTRMKHGPKLVSSRRDMGILRGPKHRLAYRLMKSRFDLVLTVSEEVRHYCIENDGLPEPTVATLYNGVEMESFTQPNGVNGLRKQFSLETGVPVVLTVGHIREIKGIDVLVKVAARVALEIPKVLFVIVGANSDPEYFHTIQTQIAELNIQQNVRFVGQTENVASFLKMGNVFFLPSRSEGFSNALIEAMASGLPCVATRVGGNPEAIEEGRSGFIVESENVETAADRILRLLREPNLARAMGAAGTEIVRARFTATVMIDQLVRHYNHLLAARHEKVQAASKTSARAISEQESFRRSVGS